MDWSQNSGALVISWTGVRAGREAKALEVLGRAMEHYTGLEKSGTLTGTHVYFVGGRGMIILDGKLGDLTKLYLDREFTKLQGEGGLVADGFSVDIATGGAFDSVAEGIGSVTEIWQEHGLL